MVNWAVLSDEQMRKIWPFSLLNDEQMSNKVGVKHQPVNKHGDRKPPKDRVLGPLPNVLFMVCK